MSRLFGMCLKIPSRMGSRFFRQCSPCNFICHKVSEVGGFLFYFKVVACNLEINARKINGVTGLESKLFSMICKQFHPFHAVIIPSKSILRCVLDNFYLIACWDKRMRQKQIQQFQNCLMQLVQDAVYNEKSISG